MSNKDSKQVQYKVGNYYDTVGGNQVKIVQLDVAFDRLLGADGFYRNERGQFDPNRTSDMDFVKIYQKIEK